MTKIPKSGNESTANLYEDFHPMSEWKEEPENNILLVHLPDFAKEQIHVTCVRSSRIVRVTGQRQLADNKWSRCNQALQIPKNCNVDKIHAKWQNGTLTITMPKETIIQPHPRKEEAKITQLEVPKSAANKQKSLKDSHRGPSTKAADNAPKYPKDQLNELQRDDSSIAISKKIHGEKKSEDGKSFDASTAQNFEKEPLLQKGDHQQDEIAFPNAAVSSSESNTIKQTYKTGNVAKAENVTEKKDNAASIEQKDAKAATKIKEKKSMVAAAIKAVKGIATEQDEDRQLMINMGVAVLVIVALGAYYGIASKSKD